MIEEEEEENLKETSENNTSNERDMKPLKNAVLNICFNLKNPSLLFTLHSQSYGEIQIFPLEQSDEKMTYK